MGVAMMKGESEKGSSSERDETVPRPNLLPLPARSEWRFLLAIPLPQSTFFLHFIQMQLII